MVPIDPDAPWWANAVVVLVVLAGVPTFATWLTGRGTRRKVAATQAGVTQVLDQVKNTHTENLRVDLDAAKAQAADAAASSRLAMEAAHRTERYVSDLAESIRAAEQSQDRRHTQNVAALGEVRGDVADVSKRLDEHLAEVPALVEEAVTRAEAAHIAACPLRTDQPPTRTTRRPRRPAGD